MEKYKNNGKTYNVESVNYSGMFIDVNGTTITDCHLQKILLDMPFGEDKGFTVFCDHDEIYFKTFEEAYNFAMNEQKNTQSLKK